MHILRLFLVVWISLTTGSSNAVSVPGERSGLMTGYEWAGFSEREQRIYFSGLLESFSFSGYSLVDSTNQDSIRSYSRFVSCLKNQTDLLLLVLNNSVALGRDLEESFAGIVWERAVPMVCEREPMSRNSLKLPLRLTSHKTWSNWNQKEKVLYHKGFLDAVTYLRIRRTGQQGDNDLTLLKEISTESKIKESIELLSRYGLELSLPIPWSIARANGSLVDRGPGYETGKKSKERSEEISGALIELWGAWVDFEAVSAVCGRHWGDLNTLTPNTFDMKRHRKLSIDYQCIAQEASATIFSTYFRDMKAPPSEIKKLGLMFSSKVLDDKKSMAQSHLSKLDPPAQISFCQENWEITSHHSRALIYKIEEAEYLLDQTPQFSRTKLAVQKAKAKCQLD